MRLDLHTHTNFSFDSKANMQEYIDKALERGVKVICFTDHIEANDLFNTFVGFEFEKRANLFDKLKKQYQQQVKLLLGVEFGEPHLHPKELQFVQSLGLDMIIGSVHYPLDYSNTHGKECSRREYERIYDQFVYDMVCAGGFEVLGHLDLPKRYHNDYVPDYAMQQKTLKMCVQNGIVPELNTSSLRKGHSEPMPSLQMIEYYKECGGKYVTVNSDSHIADDLCKEFDQVKSLLPKGLSCCYFENRKLVPVID